MTLPDLSVTIVIYLQQISNPLKASDKMLLHAINTGVICMNKDIDLSYFFPYNMLDFVKRGVESSWSFSEPAMEALVQFVPCFKSFQLSADKNGKYKRQKGTYCMNTDITKQMEMVLYRTEDDSVTVSALIKDESIWITQKAMAELFGIDKSGISRHLTKIFETGELKEEVVVAKIATTTQHGAMQGKTQINSTNYYNLDAIISVGYRVNSIQAT